jgi:xanthine/CO dehydrogenase XdhC/CoxF family maturation factor
MKHWQETSRLLQTLEAWAAAGRNAALATVVRIRGSAYRRPGAKMLVADDGTMLGSVSGGCLEADVREIALTVMRDGTPRMLHYETGGDDASPFGLGLGCNGAVDIFVQPATAPDALDTARRVAALLHGDTAFTVSTVVAGPHSIGRTLVVDGNGDRGGSTGDAALDRSIATRARELVTDGSSKLHDLEELRVFTDVQLPPPALLILGAGEDARPLAEYGAAAGFRVTIADHRPAYLDAALYPAAARIVQARPDASGSDLPMGAQTYAVVKTHSLAHDREWVRRLLASDVPYIGVLGPRDRIDDVLQQLGAQGNSRVYGPVGLDLGADGPEQIAFSIVAELLAVLSDRDARHLRERDGVIHAS